MTWQNGVAMLEAVFCCRKTSVLYGFDVRHNGIPNGHAVTHEFVHEPRSVAGKNTKHVMHDQHLAGASGARTYPNRRDKEFPRDCLSKSCRDGFNDNDLCSGSLYRQRIFQ